MNVSCVVVMSCPSSWAAHRLNAPGRRVTPHHDTSAPAKKRARERAPELIRGARGLDRQPQPLAALALGLNIALRQEGERGAKPIAVHNAVALRDLIAHRLDDG